MILVRVGCLNILSLHAVSAAYIHVECACLRLPVLLFAENCLALQHINRYFPLRFPFLEVELSCPKVHPWDTRPWQLYAVPFMPHDPLLEPLRPSSILH
ncbi:hypothetical protein B0T24DRAFT_610396 [Lasiosphaeria ovina]|uniref:Secreted protein n=1 Tax=Lasiosphaeria ovina TaxID=92902 RepID=A0AAE0KLJ2_9PEZI|nr:hypothetical protein B0T24DRAFT_610396 [Lasiosphaeria ovina]